MLNTFFKTGFRSLRKNKSFAIINIAGLAIGIAASLLIFLVIYHESHYDDYHTKKDRIYRVVSQKVNRITGATEIYSRGVPPSLPIAMRQDFPAFEKVGTFINSGGAQIYVPGPAQGMPEKQFKQDDGIFFAQPEAFDILDFTWLAGNAGGLTAPNTAVIAETLAQTWFGSTEAAIGKTIEFKSSRRKIQIQGVFKDVPANTDIQVKMAISFATVQKIASRYYASGNAWKDIDYTIQTFVLLPAGHSIAPQAAQLPGFVKKYTQSNTEDNLNLDVKFQPLSDVHLGAHYGTLKDDGLSVRELWSMGLIGAFLLLVACINFINLATAQSINRSKEIGVRKVLGSSRGQLIQQFLQETGMITLIAVALGGLLAFLSLPMLSTLIGKDMAPRPWHYPAIGLFLLALAIIVTLLAGFYPAMVVSGFKPVLIFRNKINAKAIGGISLRRALVVFQFAIAQLLVIGTIVVVQQTNFFRQKSLGFISEGTALVSLPGDSTLRTKYPLLHQRIKAVPGVEATTLCVEAPMTPWSSQSEVYFDNNPKQKPFKISLQFGDTGYVNTFGLQLVAGRQPFYSDSLREVVINEEAVKRFGMIKPEEAINKTISFDGHQWYTISGVLHNYNSRSLHVEMRPLVLMAQEGNYYDYIAIRMNPAAVSNTFAQVEKIFREVYPSYLFDPFFVDQRMARYYKAEATTSQLFTLFASLAIFISCLGLYGLVSFMAVQKTKEIGIRKVLGASLRNIVLMFSKEFTLLVILAFAVATPIGYYFMNQWLQGFYYHITIGWSVFAIAMVASVVIAWITVGYKAVRAGLVNPVKSLKTE